MSRRRRWKGRPRRGGPRGRCSSANQNRCAACERMSKLESSGSSTANNEPLPGNSCSQSRWFAPARGTIACHPSAARRKSPPGSPASSRPYRLEAAGATIPRTGSTVGRISGAQKIACLSKAFCGSAAKRQPPFVSEIVGYPARLLVARQGLIVSVVLAIAAQAFPGNVHRFCLLKICVGLL